MIFMRFLKKTSSLEEAGGHLVTDSCDEAVLGDIPPHRGWWGTAWKGHQDIPRSSKIKKGHRKRNKTQFPELQYDFVQFFYTFFLDVSGASFICFSFFPSFLKTAKNVSRVDGAVAWSSTSQCSFPFFGQWWVPGPLRRFRSSIPYHVVFFQGYQLFLIIYHIYNLVI